MATEQSGPGRIRLFEDFLGGHEVLDASTSATMPAGNFRFVGLGIAETDTQIAMLESDGLSGVVILETDDADTATTAIATSVGFDAGLMGTLVLEARVRFADRDTKVAFIGFCNDNQDAVAIETHIIDQTSAGVIENTATHICGFYFSDEATDGDDWHSVYKGGTTAAVTACADLNLGRDAADGIFQILRVEVDDNGTARWYIDGELLKTVKGAMSTSADVAAIVGVGSHGNAEYMYVDYVLVEANRDWTV